jgi:uncharacterized protein DUF4255
MSDQRAIEAVTETLRNLIDTGVQEVEAGAVVVTRPPDKVRENDGMQVNLFLYQTGIDGALRNQDPPDVRPGETGHPALPLVLHYLVTPYVGDGTEVDGHRLLGGAMSILHDHCVLSGRELADAAGYSDVSRQVEKVRITPQPLDIEGLSKLWTAFQTQYRLSAAYEVRVVLIDSRRQARAPLPVLRRGRDDRGPVAQADTALPFPVLVRAEPAGGAVAAALGGTVVLHGANLAAESVAVRLTHPLLTEPVEVDPDGRDATELTFTVPDRPADLPAGVWSASLTLTGPDGEERATNDVPLSLAPRITNPMPMTVFRDGMGTAVVPLSCVPDLRPEQRAWLLLGERAIRSEPVTGAGDIVDFRVADAEPGEYLARLRVDGVDSPLVDQSVTPPVFDATQKVTVQ